MNILTVDLAHAMVSANLRLHAADNAVLAKQHAMNAEMAKLAHEGDQLLQAQLMKDSHFKG